jgi:hypothetical protein
MSCNEKMDNTRFGFSGIAGFNKWHYFQGNQYGVWENIIRAEQHMNGQDVKNVIGTDYIQGECKTNQKIEHQLHSGIYLVKIKKENFCYTKRLIVE